MLRRWLAGQFARPSGVAGRWLIAPWLDIISRSMNRAVFAALDLRGEDRVLEVGFGGGELLQWILAATSGRVWGVDISHAAFARACRRFRREIAEGQLELALASVDSLPLPDGAADKALSVNNIYFWPDPKAAMRELARVLRPGGQLLIALETPESLRSWPGHRYGFRLFDADEVTALMKDAGFADLRVLQGIDPRLGQFLCILGSRS
jgi:ubiquinone/menaquinone biosynthesis C-methylase UbiE